MSKRKSQYTFSTAPVAKKPRNVFDLSHGNSFTLNVGDLIPYDIQEVYPGDTMPVNNSFVFRTVTGFQKPILDNLQVDQFAFFVPLRTLVDDFEDCFGGDQPDDWQGTPDWSVPQVALPTDVNIENTIADYLCLPVVARSGGEKYTVSALPFRAVAKVYNEWFRNENIIPSTFFPTYQGSSAKAEIPLLNTEEWSVTNYLGKPPKIARLKDQFTACLPAPQKGQPISVPLSPTGDESFVPVFSYRNAPQSTATGMEELIRRVYGLSDDESLTNDAIQSFLTTFVSVAGTDEYPELADVDVTSDLQRFAPYFSKGPITAAGTTATDSIGLHQGQGTSSAGNTAAILLDNLVADLSAADIGTLVNDIRTAFQMQRILERSARMGSRFVEYIYGAFGVKAPDQRLQRSEYLAGASTPLHLQQVAQTAPGTSTDSSFVGDLSAYSLTNGFMNFKKSFTEHGYVIQFLAIRQKHTYSQGIEKFWTRKTRFDFYDPTLSHIGEQPIYVDELRYNPNVAQNSQVFGYNEAWVDLRYRPSHVTAQLRPEVEENIGYWSAADFYENPPTLSKEFIEETPTFVDRTLQIPSTTAPQFICSVWIENHAIRVLPLYSTPELVDHF